MEALAHRDLHLERVTRKTLRLFYLLSPPVMGGIALAIFRLRGISVAEAFRAPVSTTGQILIGLLAGIVSGLAVGTAAVNWRRLAALRQIIRQVFALARPTLADLLLTSLSAGFSEELLFRGALQPLLGIWVTSLLFALAHGGATKPSKGNLLYGLFVFSASLLLGIVYKDAGLLAAMATHFALDLTGLLQYRYQIAAVAGNGPADPSPGN